MASDATPDTAHVEVPAGHDAGGHGDAHSQMVSDVNATMVVLTWVTFGLLAAVLYKIAWKPILAGLDEREASIRKALEDAAKAREEAERIGRERDLRIAEADAKAKAIVDTAREAAVQLGATIEAKAREEVQILMENAHREIRTEREKALAALRKESAELSVQLARKVIQQELDETRSRRLVDQLIEKI